MRITPYIAAFLVTLGLVVPTHAFADALGEANAALNREHYETALQLLRPLAKNGDAAAQYEIGSIRAPTASLLHLHASEATSCTERQLRNGT
jgi:hypothetical protein